MSSLADSVQPFAALDLAVRHRLAGLLAGDNSGLRLGPGTDAEEVVRYRAGEDDVRRIDWNVTARSTEPHVWRTLAEHELETWVLADETASMHFGTVEVEKGELAAWITGAIGLLTDRPGNRMGVAHLRADGLEWSSPLPPRRAAMRAVAHLRGGPPAAPSEDAAPALLSLGEAITQLGARHRRPGLRVVVSDFIEPDGAFTRPFPWERPLRLLTMRHEALVVEVVDPRELTLPDVGPVVLSDPETGRRTEVWTSSRRLRQQYAALAAAHRAGVAEAVRAAGAQHLVLRTDRDWVVDLARFVASRRHSRHAVPHRRAR